MASVEIRPVRFEDRNWITRFTKEQWGGPTVVVGGEVYHPEELEGHVAEEDGDIRGLVTVHGKGQVLEIVTLQALTEGQGVGSALLDCVVGEARNSGQRRIRVITTNDNLRALGFFQRRGFRITAVFPDAVTESREMKPGIPLTGESGIPVTDEIELMRDL